jgi:hypothetical protein
MNHLWIPFEFSSVFLVPGFEVLIKSLHENVVSSVKWADQRSEPFDVNQGGRQDGILSTDLYKFYINPLLKRLEATNIELRIGNISTNSTACADNGADNIFM